MDLALLSKYHKEPSTVPTSGWFRKNAKDPSRILSSYSIEKPESLGEIISEGQSSPSSQISQLEGAEFDPQVERSTVSDVPRFTPYKGPTTLSRYIDSRVNKVNKVTKL